MTSRYMQLATPIAILAASLLVGCSGAPSSSELKEVVEREIKQELKMIPSYLRVKWETPTLKDVKKVGCKADGESFYLCDVEVVLMKGAESKSQVVPMRFYKQSTGWQVVNQTADLR